MKQLFAFIAAFLTMLGCSRSQLERRPIEQSVRQLDDDDTNFLDDSRAIFREMPDTKARSRLTLILDGQCKTASRSELDALGVILGDMIAGTSPIEWVSVEFEGERMLAMNWPKTSAILFPLAMIEKRVKRGDILDLKALAADTVGTVRVAVQDPEYQR